MSRDDLKRISSKRHCMASYDRIIFSYGMCLALGKACVTAKQIFFKKTVRKILFFIFFLFIMFFCLKINGGFTPVNPKVCAKGLLLEFGDKEKERRSLLSSHFPFFPIYYHFFFLFKLIISAKLYLYILFPFLL